MLQKADNIMKIPNLGECMEGLAKQLIEKANTYMLAEDVRRIEEAYEFALDAHRDQNRFSGEPYIVHPTMVAEILVDLKLDAVTVIAALLHDVIEDTEITLEELAQEFGTEIAQLVDGVTKLGRIKYQSKEEQAAENHRKMLVAMAKDIRVILIKLADRLHNMRTLDHLPEEKQLRIAEETLEIFAPIAHRLGISAIKWELEDIALRFISPVQYYRIVNLVKEKRAERQKHVDLVIEIVKERLDELEIHSEISGRPKHIYSVYNKMTKKERPFDQIYDLLAVRILVDNIKDCYAVLGVIHTFWKPLPGRFKDFIAMPKSNMYQSLHTTVIGPNGDPVEVQIRTFEMHRTAEHGIAAHWAYKEGKAQVEDNFEEKLSWFREILEWESESRDAQEFMESLKMDIFTDIVFVFTPKGDVIELPQGSVPLDFAYRIHTEVGHRCTGAKVNGRIVPLDYTLKTGDIVEIMTSKHSYGPGQDWLKIAQSSQARSKIRGWFKKERRGENIARGRESVERELQRQGYEPSDFLTTPLIKEVLNKFNFSNEDEMYATIGYSGITASQIVTRLTEKAKGEKEKLTVKDLESRQQPVDKKRKLDGGVRVKGVDNLLVRFSKCCNPVPGDGIMGYITRGRGVSIHRVDCTNIINESDTDRLIAVEWDIGDEQESSYSADIEVTGMDRQGLLNEVLQAVSETKTLMTAVSGKANRDQMVTILITVQIMNTEHLQTVIARIKRVKDVYEVKRTMV